MKITAAQLRRIIKEEGVLYHISHKNKAKIDTYEDEKRAREEYKKLNPTWRPDTGVTLTRKNPDGKIDTLTSSGIWSNEFPSVRTEGKSMKIRLSELRKIIREEVARSLKEAGGNPVTPEVVSALKNFRSYPVFPINPVMSRMEIPGKYADEAIKSFNKFKDDYADQLAKAGIEINFTGEELAEYLQNAGTSRVSHREPHPGNPNDPNYAYNPATRRWDYVGLGVGGG